jgi:hypothetical protein
VVPYEIVPFGNVIGASVMPITAVSPTLSPEQLMELAEAHLAQAARIECGDERLRMLTIADALSNLAEIKRLLLDYERRLLN